MHQQRFSFPLDSFKTLMQFSAARVGEPAAERFRLGYNFPPSLSFSGRMTFIICRSTLPGPSCHLQASEYSLEPYPKNFVPPLLHNNNPLCKPPKNGGGGGGGAPSRKWQETWKLPPPTDPPPPPRLTPPHLALPGCAEALCPGSRPGSGAARVTVCVWPRGLQCWMLLLLVLHWTTTPPLPPGRAVPNAGGTAGALERLWTWRTAVWVRGCWGPPRSPESTAAPAPPGGTTVS